MGETTKNGRAYILATAAYNEEANIEKTIQSMLTQNELPQRWVIVSDGSIDRTDEIVQRYAEQHDFIRFLRVTRPPGRSFRTKIMALQAGIQLLADVPFQFIGNLDADVSIGPSYFAELLDKFEANPRLGIAGGFVHERKDGKLRTRSSNRAYSVAHAAQLVRRECYGAIGGYAVLEYGGEDWHAQTSARMLGWSAEAFPELTISHHRPTGTGDNLVRHKFRQGRMDYSFGSDPIFETLKCLQRLGEKPLIIGSFARFAGFFWSLLIREPRPVSAQFITFLRAEQKQKTMTLLHIAPRPDRSLGVH
jgi:glycosyltransferase involved in cell wall biosynthesis